MIQIAQGNLLTADASALVNTVNCVGHMGKGIALQFKMAFPDNYEAYRCACKAGDVRPGRMFVFETGSMIDPRYIINFPTKRHWRGKSSYEDIESGLRALVEEARRLGIESIAVPPLGCGLGGLDWDRVRLAIEKAFKDAPDIRVLLYAPVGAPDPRAMPVRTKRPSMTAARSLFIKIMAYYARFAYRLTLLEIQKLAYFLQESGEPLRLRYEEGYYGPYAHNLNKVLETLEGHFIRGYGDTQKPDVEIELLPCALKEADAFLSSHNESRRRLRRVADLVEGFETPYGMELLSSVHWVAVHQTQPVMNVEAAVRRIHCWNKRKQAMFQPEHIRVAWDCLEEKGWLHGEELD